MGRIESVQFFDEKILPEIVETSLVRKLGIGEIGEIGGIGDLERFLASAAVFSVPEIERISRNGEGGATVSIETIAVIALCAIGALGYWAINRKKKSDGAGSNAPRQNAGRSGNSQALANRQQGGIDFSAPTGDDPDATHVVRKFFDGGRRVVEDSASEVMTTQEDIVQRPNGEQRISKKTRVEKKASHRESERKPVVATYEVHRDSRFEMLVEGLRMLKEIENGETEGSLPGVDSDRRLSAGIRETAPRGSSEKEGSQIVDPNDPDYIAEQYKAWF